MQSLQQRLDDANSTLWLAMGIINTLQHSSDEIASEILARLRLGENVVELGAELSVHGQSKEE
jgi:hypothetical protein